MVRNQVPGCGHHLALVVQIDVAVGEIGPTGSHAAGQGPHGIAYEQVHNVLHWRAGRRSGAVQRRRVPMGAARFRFR
jgi:hypothetical protein